MDEMKKFAKFVACCFLSAGSYALNGFALATLWGWFVADKFGLPTIGVVEAIGVSIVASQLTMRYSKSDREISYSDATAFAYVLPLVTLPVGFIVTLFL